MGCPDGFESIRPLDARDWAPRPAFQFVDPASGSHSADANSGLSVPGRRASDAGGVFQ